MGIKQVPQTLQEVTRYLGEHPEEFATAMQRRRARMHLETFLTEDEVNSVLPRLPRGPKSGGSLQDRALKLANLDVSAKDILEFIKDNTKSANAALVTVTHLRKLLVEHDKPRLAEELLRVPMYSSLMAETSQARDEALERKHEVPANIPQEFADPGMLIHRLQELAAGIRGGTQPMDWTVITYALILFSARVSELYHLRLTDGNITGYAKQRSKDIPVRYVGPIPEEDAELILKFIKSYPKFNPATELSGQYVKFSQFLYHRYQIKPHFLRTIGADLAASKETNEYRRIKTKQAALRHQSSATQVHYTAGKPAVYATPQLQAAETVKDYIEKNYPSLSGYPAGDIPALLRGVAEIPIVRQVYANFRGNVDLNRVNTILFPGNHKLMKDVLKKRFFAITGALS